MFLGLLHDTEFYPQSYFHAKGCFFPVQLLQYHLICAYCTWVLIEVNVAFADLYLLMEIRQKAFLYSRKKLNCLLT